MESKKILMIVKKGDCIDLYQTCPSCSYVNLTTIKYPNVNVDVMNVAMTQNGTEYNYTFCNTNEIGEYFYTVKGDKDGTVTTEIISFKVNYLGKELTTSQAIIYFVLIIVIILIFAGTFFGIGFLPKSNSQDEQGRILQINYLKYLRSALWFFEWMLFIAILYLTSNIAFAFLQEEMFAQFIFTLFRITFGITPLIVILWMVWFFVKFFEDKQFKRMLERGIFPQGRL